MKYSEEFKTHVVSLLITGIKPSILMRYYNCETNYIYRWSNYEKYHKDECKLMDVYKKSINLYNSGNSIDDISKQYNIPYNIVHFWVNNEYLDIDSYASKKMQSLKNIIRDEYISGVSIPLLAKKYNTSTAAIYRITEEFGVTRKRNVLSEDEMKIISDMYKSDNKVDDIAKIIGRDISTIYRFIKKLQCEMRRGTQKIYTAEEKLEAIRLYNVEGLSCPQIGKKLNITPGVVNKWVRDRGLVRSCSEAQRGSRGSNYQGGKSYEPYCELFDNGLKERVISFWGYTCAYCGEDELNCRTRLHVHHINGNKGTCCDKTERSFVPLCEKCHSRAERGQHKVDYVDLFKSVAKVLHDGKYYYTEDEYDIKYGRCPYKTYLEIAKSIKNNKRKYRV